MSTISENLPRVRRARGYTQERLAERSGVSIDVITRLEQGRKQAARWSTLVTLANALDVTLAVLVTPPALLAHDTPAASVDVSALRAAISASGDIPAMNELAEDAETVPIAEAEDSVHRAWEQYQRGDFAVVSALLPSLIGDARRLAGASSGDEAARAATLLGTAYNIAAGITVTLGHPDLAYLAVERAVRAARDADNPLPSIATAIWLSWILIKQGRYDESERVALDAARRVEPPLTTTDPAAWATYGNLVINASCAAIRAGRVTQADNLLDIAQAAATRHPNDGIIDWAIFGPRVVAIYRVANAIEAGRFDDAVQRAQRVPAATGGRLPDTWEARFHLQLAYAHSELGNDTQAVASLSAARQRSPEWVRYYPLATSVVTDLLDRPNRPSSELADLATHLRVL